MLVTEPKPAPSSDRQLAASIGKSTVFGVIASAAQVITRMITVPLVIHYLGLGAYGIWNIIMVTAAYMRFGTAGLKSAFQKYVAEALATGEFEHCNRLLSTGSISMLVLSLAAFVPLAMFSRKLAVLASVPPEFVHSAAASITVLAGIYAVSNFGATYESIVMGAHRADITRKVNTVLTIAEAVAIVAALAMGYGLLAMTLVMGISELIYIGCCYYMARRIVPQIQVRLQFLSKSVYPELLRFAGSYQMLNVLEVIYFAVVPTVILKEFGANASGIYALTTRVVSSALMAQDALVLPILSAGTMIFAMGAADKAEQFLAKAFKVTIGAALPALAFVAAFGTTMIVGWTGEMDTRFATALWIAAITALLRAVATLQLVVYRASGRAVLDNLRQLLRIAVIVIVAFLSKRLGFFGVLAGMALAELLGVFFMFFATASQFHAFNAKSMGRDVLRISAATIVVIGTGAIAGMVPIPWSLTERFMALAKLSEILLGCAIAVWPALALTNCISPAERRMIWDAILPGRKTAEATGSV